MNLPVYKVVVHVCSERALDVTDCSTEIDPAAALGDLVNRKAVFLKPAEDRRESGIRNTKTLSELIGCNPMVEDGRAWIVNVAKKLIEVLSGRRPGPEREDHPVHRK